MGIKCLDGNKFRSATMAEATIAQPDASLAHRRRPPRKAHEMYCTSPPSSPPPPNDPARHRIPTCAATRTLPTTDGKTSPRGDMCAPSALHANTLPSPEPNLGRSSSVQQPCAVAPCTSPERILPAVAEPTAAERACPPPAPCTPPQGAFPQPPATTPPRGHMSTPPALHAKPLQVPSTEPSTGRFSSMQQPCSLHVTRLLGSPISTSTWFGSANSK